MPDPKTPRPACIDENGRLHLDHPEYDEEAVERYAAENPHLFPDGVPVHQDHLHGGPDGGPPEGDHVEHDDD